MMSRLLQNQNFGSQTQLSCTDKAEDFVRIMTDQYNPAKKYITPFCNSFVCIYIYIYIALSEGHTCTIDKSYVTCFILNFH